jgi:hypothetical protein
VSSTAHSATTRSGTASYDSTSCGWRCELGAVRYDLERFPGWPRDPLWITRELKPSLDEAYALLLGPRGLSLDPPDAESR